MKNMIRYMNKIASNFGLCLNCHPQRKSLDFDLSVLSHIEHVFLFIQFCASLIYTIFIADFCLTILGYIQLKMFSILPFRNIIKLFIPNFKKVTPKHLWLYNNTSDPPVPLKARLLQMIRV